MAYNLMNSTSCATLLFSSRILQPIAMTIYAWNELREWMIREVWVRKWRFGGFRVNCTFISRCFSLSLLINYFRFWPATTGVGMGFTTYGI